MEVNILTEILFGFGIGLGCAIVASGFAMVMHSFQTVGDVG